MQGIRTIRTRNPTRADADRPPRKLDTHGTKLMAGDIGLILKACRTPVVGPHQTKERTRCAEKPSPSFRTSPRPKTSSGAPLPRQSAFWQAPASGLRRRELPQPEQELRSPLSSIHCKSKSMTPQQIALVQCSFKSVCTDRLKGRRSFLRPALRDRSRGAAALPCRLVRAEGQADGDA